MNTSFPASPSSGAILSFIENQNVDENSVDPDQLASSESTLFAKEGIENLCTQYAC